MDDKTTLLNKKEALKKEIKEINKKLKNISAREYQCLDKNFVFCEYCKRNVSKYALSKHEQTEKHILKSQLAKQNIKTT